MSLGRREARHQTVAAAHTAVDASQWWAFQPGQQVMTCDKIAGVVTDVEDGPFAGNESYRVKLDNGLGGGLYAAGQLAPLAKPTASFEGTAAADYPELGTILVDRPDIAPNTVLASRKTASEKTCPTCDGEGNQWASSGPYMRQMECEDCGGSGVKDDDEDHHEASKTAANACPSCNGMEAYPGEHDDNPALHGTTMVSQAPPETWMDHGGVNGPSLQRMTTPASDFENMPHLHMERARHRSEQRAERQTGADMDHMVDDFTPLRPSLSSASPEAQEFARRVMERYTALDQTEIDHCAMVVQAALDPDFRFQITASWADVRRKAANIRKSGGVNIVSAHEGALVAYVQGEHGVYESELDLIPGTRRVGTWQCGCKWAAYAWGRSPRYKRFEGRMCSHALATQYEAQSRGMFGRGVSEDEKKAPWVKRRVIVDYDIDSGKNRQRNVTPNRNHRHVFTSTLQLTAAAQESPLMALLVEAALAGVNHDEMAYLLSSNSLDPSRIMPLAYTAAMQETRMREHHKRHEHTAPNHDRGYVYPYWGGALCNVCMGGGCGHCNQTGLEPGGQSSDISSASTPAETDGGAGDAAGAVDGGATGAANDPFGVGDSNDATQSYQAATPVANDGNPISTGFATSADPEGWNQGTNPMGHLGFSQASYTDDDEFPFEVTSSTRPEEISRVGTMSEEPEPALPTTDGDAGMGTGISDMEDDELTPNVMASRQQRQEIMSLASIRPDLAPPPTPAGDVNDIVAAFQQQSGLMGRTQSSKPRAGDSEIAAMALRFLQTGSLPEQAQVDPASLIGDDPSLGKPIVTTALKSYSPGEQAAIINEGKGTTASNLDRLDVTGTHYEALDAARADMANDDDWMA